MVLLEVVGLTAHSVSGVSGGHRVVLAVGKARSITDRILDFANATVYIHLSIFVVRLLALLCEQRSTLDVRI